MKDAFHLAASRPWLIQEAALHTILEIADRRGDPEALQVREGRKLEGTRRVSMRDGVARIPITGPIFRHANLFTDISGATSTGTLALDIQAAIDNPYIRGLVLDISSPGGEAAGIHEMGELIHAARSRKRIVAYVGDTAASAAYWLASAADEVVIDETAMLGSIGVVMSYLDTTERDSKSGVRRVEIVSSQSPDKRYDPATEEGRAKVQAIVDALAETFVARVARNRNTTTARVLSDFGRGDVLVGRAAVKAGMADRIGSLESVIAELAGTASSSKRNSPMNTDQQKGQVTVSNTADLRTAFAAGYTAEQINIAAPDAAIAAARAEGLAEGQKQATAAAVTAERERITSIRAMTRPGFEKEAEAAINAGDKPEAFAMALLRAANDRGITLDAMRADAPNAAPFAAAPNAEGAKAPKRIDAAGIFQARRNAAAAK